MWEERVGTGEPAEERRESLHGVNCQLPANNSRHDARLKKWERASGRFSWEMKWRTWICMPSCVHAILEAM